MMSSPNLMHALPPTIQCAPLCEPGNDAHGYQLRHPQLGTLGYIWVAASGQELPKIHARLARSPSLELTEQRRVLFNPLSRKIRAQFSTPQNALQTLTPEDIPYCPSELRIRSLRCDDCRALLGRFVMVAHANTPAQLIAIKHAYYAIIAAWTLPTWIVGGRAIADNDTLLVLMSQTETTPHEISLGLLNKMIRAKQRNHCCAPDGHAASHHNRYNVRNPVKPLSAISLVNFS